MKSKIAFVIVFFLSLTEMSAQKNIDVTVAHSIKEVTLYLNGAEIRSNEPVNLRKGETKIIITGISPFMQDESVQVAVRESVEIISVTTRETKMNLEKLSSEALQTAQGIKKTESKINLLTAQIDGLA